MHKAGLFASAFDRTLPMSVNASTVLISGPSTKSTYLQYDVGHVRAYQDGDTWAHCSCCAYAGSATGCVARRPRCRCPTTRSTTPLWPPSTCTRAR